MSCAFFLRTMANFRLYSTFFVLFKLTAQAQIPERTDPSRGAVVSYNQQTLDANAKIYVPENVEVLQNFLITTSKQPEIKVRVAGTSHSTNSMILSDGIYISTEKLNRIGDIETRGSEAFISVQAGVKLGDLSEYLNTRGYTLGFAYPAYRDMTIAGLLSTGSHGSSRLHPAVSSQRIVEMGLVNARGELLTVNQEKPELLKAARVSLGALGVIHEVKLRIEPQFNLEMKTKALKAETALLAKPASGKVNWGEVSDYEAIVWFPHNDESVKFSGTKTNKPSDPESDNITLGSSDQVDVTDHIAKFLLGVGRRHPVLYQVAEFVRQKGLIENPPYIYKKDGKDVSSKSVVGPSHRMLLARRAKLNKIYSLQDYSFAFPESEAFSVLSTIRDFSKRHNYRFPFVGVYFRFGHSDGSSFMSHIERPGQSPQPYVMAEFIEYRELNRPGEQVTARSKLRDELLNQLVTKHKVSFHWAKNDDRVLTLQNADINYGENLQRFEGIEEAMDPNHQFRSKHLNQFLSGSKRSSCRSAVSTLE